MSPRRLSPPFAFGAFIAFLLIASLVAVPTTARTGGDVAITLSDETDGKYVLGFKPDVTEESARSVADLAGLSAGKWLPRVKALQVWPINADNSQRVVQVVRQDSRVRYLEPDWPVHVVFDPNDPRYNLQWAPPLIGAEEAWDETLGSSSVIVAIVDTGIHKTHADISGKTTSYEYDHHNDDWNAADDNGHGTHVGGIVGAAFNNSTGVASIGGHTKIMPMKVLGSSGSGSSSNVAAGVEDAADHDADVINMSLGSSSQSQVLEDAVDYAYDEGVLVVSASGNNGTSSPFYPAAYANSMAIGATNSSDNRASFSNYGSWLDMVAPGVTIQSTWCCSGGSSYVYASGTSMAAPHVSAVAALMLAINPNLDPDDLRDILTDTAVDIGTPGHDNYTGDGRLNAEDAVLDSMIATPTFTPTPSPTPTPFTQTFTTQADAFVVSADPDGNYGSNPLLHIGIGPEYHSYLRFNPQGVGTDVLSATLKLLAADTGSGYDVRSVADNGWSESGITWNNAPVAGTVIGSMGTYNPGQWTAVNVTSAVVGSGQISFMLDAGGKISALTSKEGGLAPELVIVSQGGDPPPTATSSPTHVPTGGATATNTPLPTATNTALPTATNTALPTATNTPLPTATNTALPTATNTPLPTATNTALPTATNTPLPTSTNTALPTATNTPLPTATNTPLPTATNTPLPTATNTPLPTATNTAVPTSTSTASPTTPPSQTPTSGASPTPTATATPYVFSASADALVDEAQPARNYGPYPFFVTDQSPDRHSYLKFNVTGISGTVSSATLHLYAHYAATTGVDARSVSDTSWGEATITWNNKPAQGGSVGTSGGFSAGWIDVDVTPLVSGNGMVSVALRSLVDERLSFSAREDVTHAPQLIITTE